MTCQKQHGQVNYNNERMIPVGQHLSVIFRDTQLCHRLLMFIQSNVN